ncbi:MAG: RtcB family protein [Armatimonadota bacterium]
MTSTESKQKTSELLPPEMQLSARQHRIVDRLAGLPGRTGPVGLLPDISFKPKNPYPTGAVTCFEDHLAPAAIGASINCGMSFLRLLADGTDISQSDWRRVLEEIDRAAKDFTADTPSLTEDALYKGLLDPHGFVSDLGYSSDEIQRIEASGFRLCDAITAEEITQSVPEFAIRGTLLSVGELGGGNHFIEFHRANEIEQPAVAETLGIKPGGYTMAVHSSGPLGPLVSLMYSRRPEVSGTLAFKMAIRKALFHLRLPAGFSSLLAVLRGAQSLPVNSALGQSFAHAYDAAAACGYIHRAMIVQKIREILDTTLGVGAELVCDLSHNGIWRETIGGQEVFVHRHGACSFRPPGFFPEGHPYAETGQPAFVGSSMSTPSAIVVPGDSAAKTHYSINHGTGRVQEKSHAPATSAAEYLESRGIVAHVSGSGSIAGQLGYNYRPIEDVMSVLTGAGVARPVAMVTPVASLKYT